MTRIDLKKFALAVTISSALGFSAFGLGAGLASADTLTPKAGPVTWSQDKGGHGHDWDGPGPGWGPGWRGPGHIPWPAACVQATDPTGLVSGFICA